MLKTAPLKLGRHVHVAMLCGIQLMTPGASGVARLQIIALYDHVPGQIVTS